MKLHLHIVWLHCVLRLTVCQTGLTEEEKQLILDEHNRIRRNVVPTASNMQLLVWNDELAQIAQAHAEVCRFAFNPNRERGSFSSVGQNFGVESGAADYLRIIRNQWESQSAFYNGATGSCLLSCTLYTQVVWATTRNIGCGAFRCDNIPNIGRNFLFFDCNYSPEGNFANQLAYQLGAPASSCPPSAPFISNGLCYNCAQPDAPMNGVVLSLSARNVSVRCNDGYRPSTEVISYCNDAMWTPEPSEHTCTLISESVDLFLLRSEPVDCPGDSVIFNCSVQSNHEHISQTWQITLPGEIVPIEIIFDNSSTENVVMNYEMNISAGLTRFIKDEYIESTVSLTLLSHDIMNGTRVNCSTPTDSVEEHWSFSVPLAPSGLTITGEYHAIRNVTVTFEWNLPIGSSHEAIDYYRIYISPTPLFPTSNVATSLSWNATLEYDTVYIVNITAITCVGESEAHVLNDTLVIESCGIPISPMFGHLDRYYNTSIGSRITYECDDGYLPSGKMTAICNNSLQWTPDPQELVCESCDVPIPPMFGHFDEYYNTSVGSRITYECDDGYLPSGKMTAICNNSLLWTPDPQELVCESCDVPIPPMFGHFDEYYNTSVGSRITYECDDGYLPSGKMTAICNNSLLWTPDPQELVCESCDVPIPPMFGHFDGYYNTSVGSRITYECDDGYLPSGKMTAICNNSLLWTPDPQELVCESCDVPIPPMFGHFDEYYNTSVGSRITYECDDGYLPSGKMTAVCNNSLLWTPDPQELVCESCDVPIPPMFGHFDEYYNTSVGSRITYECDDGYLPSGKMTAVCNNSLKWTPDPQELVCESCDVPISPMFGHLDRYYDTSVGSRITYECDDGYLPSGKMTAICSNSLQWTPDPQELVCESCAIPIPPMFGHFDGYYDNSTSVGTRITYECDDGYLPSGTKTAICNSSLQWTPELFCTLERTAEVTDTTRIPALAGVFSALGLISIVCLAFFIWYYRKFFKKKRNVAPRMSTSTANLSEDSPVKDRFVRVYNLESEDAIISQPSAVHYGKTATTTAEQQPLPVMSEKENKIFTPMMQFAGKHEPIDDSTKEKSQTSSIQAIPAGTQGIVLQVREHKVPEISAENQQIPDTILQVPLQIVEKQRVSEKSRQIPDTPPRESYESQSSGPLDKKQEHAYEDKESDDTPISHQDPMSKEKDAELELGDQENSIIDVLTLTVKQRLADIRLKEISMKSTDDRRMGVKSVSDHYDADSNMYGVSEECYTQLPDSIAEDTPVVANETVVSSPEQEALLKPREDGLQAGMGKDSDTLRVINLDLVHDEEVIKEENSHDADDRDDVLSTVI